MKGKKWLIETGVEMRERLYKVGGLEIPFCFNIHKLFFL